MNGVARMLCPNSVLTSWDLFRRQRPQGAEDCGPRREPREPATHPAFGTLFRSAKERNAQRALFNPRLTPWATLFRSSGTAYCELFKLGTSETNRALP